METLDIVKTAVAALEDKKAEDITVIDTKQACMQSRLREITSLPGF